MKTRLITIISGLLFIGLQACQPPETDLSKYIIEDYQFPDTLWDWKLEGNTLTISPVHLTDVRSWNIELSLIDWSLGRQILLGKEDYTLMDNQIQIHGIELGESDPKNLRPDMSIKPITEDMIISSKGFSNVRLRSFKGPNRLMRPFPGFYKEKWVFILESEIDKLDQADRLRYKLAVSEYLKDFIKPVNNHGVLPPAKKMP